MSELVQMRQRIKAIEIIKKITRAMRLISMSAHSRLKRTEQAFTAYSLAISSLLSKVQLLHPNLPYRLLSPTTENSKRLIILVGSQKGLCGNFNTLLFQFFTHHIPEYEKEGFDLIIVGKKAVDFAQPLYSSATIASYNDFNTHNLFSIAQDVTNRLIQNHHGYHAVTVFSNKLKNFFIQKPSRYDFASSPAASTAPVPPLHEEYIVDNNATDTTDLIARQHLEACLQYTFFKSLTAEHAARFISMDNATRNASNLLETTKMNYNKLRQAKITKELTELTSSF